MVLAFDICADADPSLFTHLKNIKLPSELNSFTFHLGGA
jgi:hypothetical protein